MHLMLDARHCMRHPKSRTKDCDGFVLTYGVVGVTREGAKGHLIDHRKKLTALPPLHFLPPPRVYMLPLAGTGNRILRHTI